MIIVLYSIGFFLFLNGIYQLIKYNIVITELRKKPLHPTFRGRGLFGKMHKIVILAPVLHEEETIEGFIAELRLQNYPKDLYQVYIITTEREYREQGKLNTIDILDSIISKNNHSSFQFNILHYPEINGFKSDQLNFALDQIRKKITDIELSESFFLLLDADGELDPNMLLTFNESIETGIEVYQQPSLRLKNIAMLKSSLMQSFALLQSFFAISYEVPMFASRFFPWRLQYFIAHGLLLKGSFLNRVGGFPDLIEDVRLGRLSSFLNVKVKLVSGFGIVETAKSLSIYIKQSSVWFFGCGLFITDYLYALRFRGFVVRDFILILYGIFKALRWLNKGLFHFLGLIFSIIYLNIPLILLFSLSLLINSSIPVLFIMRDLSMVWDTNIIRGVKKRSIMLRAIIFSPIMYIFNCIGLYYGVLKLIKYYLWGKVALPKTDR